MGHWGYGFAGGLMMGWWGPLVMLVFWGAVIAGMVSVTKWFVRRSSPPEEQESVFDILKRRYAAGEISGVEYEELKKDLF